MVRSIARKFALAAPLALLPSLALAHTGHGETSGFVAGFSHPIGGLDHILAMVMVGIFAWQLGGKALWALPASFIGVMALGGILGVVGMPLPLLETGITVSVIVLGAAVAFALRPPLAAAVGLCGLFGLYHGYAHGAEMPESAGGLAYAAGFILATALLHAVGIAAGFGIGSLGVKFGPKFMRAAGAVAAVAGFGILAGVL